MRVKNKTAKFRKLSMQKCSKQLQLKTKQGINAIKIHHDKERNTSR
jgi:hypothetical protein